MARLPVGLVACGLVACRTRCLLLGCLWDWLPVADVSTLRCSTLSPRPPLLGCFAGIILFCFDINFIHNIFHNRRYFWRVLVEVKKIGTELPYLDPGR